ncbi:MAG: translocation/assembly module TamB, partial [Acidobacteria bacterium]|nr:translocation/assembly module TamB [Acidobacteriota bacterium]
MDDVVARLGGGTVRLGGRIGLTGYVPGQLNLTATGERMRLRYPEGFNSVVDADLALRGETANPMLTGTVTIRSAVWSRRLEGGSGLLGLVATTAAAAPTSGAALPLRFDVRLLASSTLRIENNVAQIVASADLTLRGTYERPLIFGQSQIERGWLLFEGNRYQVTRGSIDFANPARIDPFFDLEVETRVRVPGQTYRVT